MATDDWYEEPPALSRKPWLAFVIAAAVFLVAGGGYLLNRSEAPAFPQRVLAKSPVNCRAAPSVASESQQVIYNNYPFRVAEEKDGWLRTEGSDCWVKADLVTVLPSGPTEGVHEPSTTKDTASVTSSGPSSATPDTPTGRATCMEAIGQSAARACEVTVLDALYNGSPPDRRISSQVFSRQAQKQCPGSGPLISTLYQAAANNLITQLSPGWTAIDARGNPGDLMLTRCLGEVAGVSSTVPGVDAEMDRYR
nr:hypothetical protein [uncultured Novosphingobium sp.]